MQKIQIQQSKKIICSQGEDAPIVCQNQSCEKYAFICLDTKCQCQKQHDECVKAVCDSLIKILNKKIISLKDVQEKITKNIDKIIDQLSEFKDKILTQIKQNYEFFGLSEIQQLFMNSIKTGQIKDIMGKQTWQIHLNLKKQVYAVKLMSQVQKQVEKICINYEKQCKQFQVDLQRQLNILNSKLFAESNVLKSKYDSDRVSKMFDSKAIKSATLLYRASESNFQVAKFHQKCDNIQNTITFVETQFQKIIGGFTPPPWNCKNQYGIDDGGISFIFSVTNNDKFILNKKQTAIFRNSGYGPTFGEGHDLYISNSSNTLNNSHSNINTSYCNNNYKQGDKDSWTRFSGSPNDNKFKTKQWEVWKLQFK